MPDVNKKVSTRLGVAAVLIASMTALAAQTRPAEGDRAGAPARGNPTAPLTLVEFSDFQCPFCGRYSRDTFDQLARDYVDTGKVRYVFRHFPIESLHPRLR